MPRIAQESPKRLIFIRVLKNLKRIIKKQTNKQNKKQKQ